MSKPIINLKQCEEIMQMIAPKGCGKECACDFTPQLRAVFEQLEDDPAEAFAKHTGGAMRSIRAGAVDSGSLFMGLMLGVITAAFSNHPNARASIDGAVDLMNRRMQ